MPNPKETLGQTSQPKNLNDSDTARYNADDLDILRRALRFNGFVQAGEAEILIPILISIYEIQKICKGIRAEMEQGIDSERIMPSITKIQEITRQTSAFHYHILKIKKN
ncbi:MAG: hypothetical protein N4A36_03010 [Candidatus Gracilibacteria bacterium]|jgi:hypothetical protein|nr:hypothetical protein [Candidatus Gracilibacteria bacterium]